MNHLANLLNEQYERFNQIDFIPNDPVSIPHQFNRLQDIEIMGFFAATLAWGQRKTIINKCNELIQLFENEPYNFILQHQESDLKRFVNFKHRTFNATDTLYFIAFFRDYYAKNNSLESAFTIGLSPDDESVKISLENFHRLFFSLEDFPSRTKKHVATPAHKAACKRLNMFLRWMVRKDNKGVDFGLWKGIKPAQLICPCDVHVERVARKLGLITRTKLDWLTAEELTKNLKLFDASDPVKYDFALFSLGIEKYL